MPVPIINIPPKNRTVLERADFESETVPPNLDRELEAKKIPHTTATQRGTVPPNPEREPKSGTFTPSTATSSKLSRKFPPGERSVPSSVIPPRESEQSVKRGTVPAYTCQTSSILQM